MRKALILLVVFAVVGAAAFADTAMGPVAKWSIGTWDGFAINPSNALIAYDYSWVGSGATRLGFTYTAADGNAGFNSRLQLAAGTGSMGTVTAFTGLTNVLNFNQLNGWAKMFGGMFTVRAGINDDYTLATKDWNCFGNTDGQFGLFFDVTPVAGLDIGFFQVTPTTNLYDNDIVGLSYTLKDTVSVQAGAYLNSVTNATTGTAVYFGAQVLAVKGVTAILEGKVTMATTMITALEQNIGYAAGPVTVGSRIGEKITGSTLVWGAEPTVSYKVNDNITFNVIGNIYTDAGQTWMSPLDAGIGLAGGTSGTMNFGGGASVNYAVDGMTLTVGDYYAAATGSGNIIYVNADISL